MKQIIYNRYGSFNDLEMVDRPTPTPAAGQVLVDVKATAINPLDWKILEGQMKLMTGSKFPRGIGIEFSGVVSQLGSSVTRFQVGDAVFGMLEAFKGGALAEQVVAKVEQIQIKPPNLSFVEAAALPISGTSALQILDDLASVHEGSEILINGAGGGIGTLLMQIAKRRGAIVTAVVSRRGIGLAKKLKSDFVVDYSTTPLQQLAQRFDVVIDLSDKLPFAQAMALMKPSATYVNTLPDPKSMAAGAIHNIFSARKRKILVMKPTQEKLTTVADYARDWMDLVIGKTAQWSEFKSTYAEVKAAGTLGKAVFSISA